MNRKVAAGEFVKRQTRESGYSHFEGTWALLEKIVEMRLASHEKPFLDEEDPVTPGYRDGVILVDIGRRFTPLFRSAVVDLAEDTQLQTSYAPRRPGEAPFIRVSAKAEKQVAKYVQVVLYRHDVLEENGERETDAEWEIVAIKARHSLDEEPMDPYTMARNFLHLQGGTKGDFTAEQFAKSIVYWNNHAMSAGKPKWYRKIASLVRGKGK
jgi:Protein of unknown function (DUF3228)